LNQPICDPLILCFDMRPSDRRKWLYAQNAQLCWKSIYPPLGSINTVLRITAISDLLTFLHFKATLGGPSAVLRRGGCNSWPGIPCELWGVTVRALVCIFVDAVAESFHSAVLDSSLADVVLTVLFSILLLLTSFCVLLLLDCSVCLSSCSVS